MITMEVFNKEITQRNAVEEQQIPSSQLTQKGTTSTYRRRGRTQRSISIGHTISLNKEMNKKIYENEKNSC